MTTTARTAETVMLWAPKPASSRESEKMETTTTIASAATVPKACTKSARASASPRRRASSGRRSSTSTLGTASANTENHASATKYTPVKTSTREAASGRKGTIPTSHARTAALLPSVASITAQT